MVESMGCPVLTIIFNHLHMPKNRWSGVKFDSVCDSFLVNTQEREINQETPVCCLTLVFVLSWLDCFVVRKITHTQCCFRMYFVAGCSSLLSSLSII